MPARWRRNRPQRVHLDWSEDGALTSGARAERGRRAAALGIDPDTLTSDLIPAGKSPSEALMMWSRNGDMLADGTTPVFTEEADRVKLHGRATEAVIAALDLVPVRVDHRDPTRVTLDSGRLSAL